jgi:uncharacterized protein with NRDE domain
MTDTTRAGKDMLPNTGCDPDWEHGLSSIFIEVQTDEVSIQFFAPSVYKYMQSSIAEKIHLLEPK